MIWDFLNPEVSPNVGKRAVRMMVGRYSWSDIRQMTGTNMTYLHQHVRTAEYGTSYLAYRGRLQG